MYDDTILNDLIAALKADPAFKFKHVRNELRDGVCPNCGQPELFVKLDKPFRVQCRRYNNCNYTETTRTLYPDIFENFSKRYPSNEQDPDATARAYLAYNRGFDLERIKGMWQQSWKKLGEKHFAATIRVNITPNLFWERLIDEENVRANGGKKNRVIGDYAGDGWVPPGMTFEQGDIIWITEGIFKSMALLHRDIKAISALSASNLPRNIIKANAGKEITWVLAYDNDHAGITYSNKYIHELEALKEFHQVALPEIGSDWDDLFRAGKITDKYIQESFWRGWYYCSEYANRRAFFHWARYRWNHHVFTFNNALYKYTVDSKKQENPILVGANELWDLDPKDIDKFVADFSQFTKIERISNCQPHFQYIEQDVLTDEQFYNFEFKFTSGNPTIQVALDGSALESATAFNKALLTRTPGGTFDGSIGDLKRLRDDWFNQKITYVKTVPFLGYDRDSKTYIFPGFGYANGQRLEYSKEGYMISGKQRLKCGLRSMTVTGGKQLDSEWISDYQDTFSLNGMVLMAWWLGTLFAEQIRDQQYSWPFLEYTGDQGAGKSTQIEFMWRCCGRDNYEGFDPSKSTHAGRARNFQQVANLPVVLMEGDRNSDDRGARKGTFDMDELKTAYNGRGIRAMGIKKRGAETEEPLFRGAILISQNASVDGSDALLSRIVHCHCTREHFTRETEQKARRLSALTIEDLAGWMDKALRHETLLLDNYFIKFKEMETKFRDQGKGIQNRLILNHAQVAAWIWLLPYLFGESRITKSTCQKVEDHLWLRCQDRQRRLQADHPLVEQFWDYYAYLNFVQDPEYKGATRQILNHTKDTDMVAISLPHFLEVCNRRNMDRLPMAELKRLLPTSRIHKLIDQRKVRSAINGEIVHVWVFEYKDDRKIKQE